MKLYLDDLRVPSEEFDFIARNYEEAIGIVQEHGCMSYTDDEGQPLKSGFDFAKWLVEADINGTYPLAKNFTYKVHSQNPVGKANIIALLDGYLRLKKLYEN